MTYISPWSYRRQWCRWAAGGDARLSPAPRLSRWLGSRRMVWSRTSSAPTRSRLGSGGQLVSSQSDWCPLTHTLTQSFFILISTHDCFFSLFSHFTHHIYMIFITDTFSVASESFNFVIRFYLVPCVYILYIMYLLSNIFCLISNSVTPFLLKKSFVNLCCFFCISFELLCKVCTCVIAPGIFSPR